MSDPIRLYELLEQHQLLSESFEVEFKSAKGGLPGSLWETYVAFANSEGGTIVLGVSEKNDEPQFDGLPKEHLKRLQSDFWSGVNNRAKVSVNLLSENMVQVLAAGDELYLLAIYVPPADYRRKPVYLGADPMKGTFKRNHTGDYHCTSEEVRQMIADALPQKPDARILEAFSMADLDETSLLQYRQLFRSRKPVHPYLTETDQGLLQKIGG